MGWEFQFGQLGNNAALGGAPLPLPVPTYKTSATSGSSSATQSITGIDVSSAVDQMVIISGTFAGDPSGTAISSITLTPNAGSPITGAVVIQVTTAGTEGAWVATVLVPGGTSGANNSTITYVYGSNPFITTRNSVWTAANLNSTTAVDAKSSASSSAAFRTVSLTTSSGGFYVAAGVDQQFAANGATWTGTEGTLTKRDDVSAAGGQHSSADASGTAALVAADVVTVTWLQLTFATAMVAASWR